jgi:ABC-type transporter Mla subunit MlaD
MEMPTIQVSTKEELNKAVYELAVLIQVLCKGERIEQLKEVVQSASALVNVTQHLLD